MHTCDSYNTLPFASFCEATLACKCLLSVIAMWHLSVSSGDCCHHGFLQLIPRALGFTLCAQLWSRGIKVNSNQTGCGVEQGLMGLYSLLYMQRAIRDQAEAAWMEVRARWGQRRGRERERERVGERVGARARQNRDADYLADHVSSRSSPWQR